MKTVIELHDKYLQVRLCFSVLKLNSCCKWFALCLPPKLVAAQGTSKEVTVQCRCSSILEDNGGSCFVGSLMLFIKKHR